MKKKLVLTLLFFVCAAPCFGQAWIHPFDFPQSKQCPQEVMAVVEIPAGSFIKYELDKATGHVVVDRFQSVPMVYPANYGTLTQTLAGDGDNLDVLYLHALADSIGSFDSRPTNRDVENG